METEAKDLVKFFKGVGLEVHTTTKARGHQGFYMKNRIDISKNVAPDRLIPTLLHEFAHYIHSQIEPFMEKTGGSIGVIFDDDNPDFYLDELMAVTMWVDKNSKFEKLKSHKEAVKSEISKYENIIKKHYPNFMRSKKFKEFDKYIKGSDARYLLRYDRIKLITRGLKKTTKIYSIDNIEKDFCDMPEEFAAYIRLKSYQKRQSRISSRMNRLGKYYAKPTELFARFVEGLYLDNETVQKIAPNSYKRFFDLMNSGYYKELSQIKDYLFYSHKCEE